MNGKIALVTGGTSGIGKEIVKELLEKGCKVITCYASNIDAANKTKEEFNSDNLFIIKCDVSNENEVIEEEIAPGKPSFIIFLKIKKSI